MPLTSFINKIIAILLLFFLTACQEPATPQNQEQQDHIVGQTLYTALNHPDRPDADRARDERRKPAKVLEFFGVKPGMTVIEIMSEGGYYTEILSRVVGESGAVYSHNNKMYYDFQSDKFVKQRLNNNRLPNVIRHDTELSDLKLADNSLDAVFIMLVYHDFYWSEDNPIKVLEQLYAALKPGAILAIIDHSAPDNSGTTAAQNLHGIHRIDEQLVKQKLQSVGFVLDGESDILRNENDPRDKAFFDKSMQNIPTDRFVLRYKKPLAPGKKPLATNQKPLTSGSQ